MPINTTKFYRIARYIPRNSNIRNLSTSRVNNFAKTDYKNSLLRNIPIKKRQNFVILTSVLTAGIAIYAFNSKTNIITNESFVQSKIKQSPSNDEASKAGKNDPLRMVTPDEVAKHNTTNDCWCVIENKVYNLTDFIIMHPGGPEIIKGNAGMDVTNIFKPLHASDILAKYIRPEWIVGQLTEPMPASLIAPPYTPGETIEEFEQKQQLRKQLPDLNSIINLYDFEKLASAILSNQAWAYYSSGADDEITMRENHNAYHRIFFKPRVLVDVSKVDTSTKVLNKTVDVPFYVTATALMKLGNPANGEMDVARGCGLSHVKVPQMISTLASCSVDEITNAKTDPDQVQWYQLYVNSDRKITQNLVKHIEQLGLSAIFVTVDAPALGHREKDLKIKFTTASKKNETNTSTEDDNKDSGFSGPEVMKDMSKNEKVSSGASRAISQFIDPSLTWNDIVELKKFTKLPIIIKGVQRVEDALKAAKIGCSGVVISNHGGRQLDFVRSPIEILSEVKPALDKNGYRNFDIFVDGGIRRGTDIIKALCLGATSCGIGRPFIYANSCYGKEGVAKAITLLQEELEMDMRLLGVTSIDQLGPDLIDTASLKLRNVEVPHDKISDSLYKPSTLVNFRDD